MSYRDYPPSELLLIGYDPERDVAENHLARFVDRVVEESVQPPVHKHGRGQPKFDPRLCLKVLIYGYATGLRSSRQLEKLCQDNLPCKLLTRGDTPSYRTLNTVRKESQELLKECWTNLFVVADACGIKRVGRITLDSTKIAANVSSESVIKREDFPIIKTMLEEILKEASEQDTVEDTEGYAGTTLLDKPIGKDQMRDILRKARKAAKARTAGNAEAKPKEVSLAPRMKERLEAAVSELATAIEGDRKHLSLTDPDAQMMGEGSAKRIRECHALEVAADNGLLVASQSSQSPTDNNRLMGLVAAAKEQEPEGVSAVTADSGYFGGDNVVQMEAQGISTCIPDSNTVRDIRKKQKVGTTLSAGKGSITMTYEAAENCYRCEQGRILKFKQQRRESGQVMNIYRAEVSCEDCSLKARCLRNNETKHRTLKVGIHRTEVTEALARFNDPAHQQRYHNRGKDVETVFSYMRQVLSYTRWLLRGKEKVAEEGNLMSLGYQFRKIHRKWAICP